MTIAYKPIQPLPPRVYEKMKKAEIRAAYQKFLDMVPERIAMLRQLVQHGPTPGALPALDAVEAWARGYARKRPLTPEEAGTIRNFLPPGSTLPTHTLTEEAESVGIDVGIVVAQSLVDRSNGQASFALRLKSPRDSLYGHPVVQGTNRMAFPPAQVGLNVMRRFADHADIEGGLAGLCERWRIDLGLDELT